MSTVALSGVHRDFYTCQGNLHEHSDFERVCSVYFHCTVTHGDNHLHGGFCTWKTEFKHSDTYTCKAL